MAEDYERYPPKQAQKPKRRRRIYVTGWNVRVVVTLAGMAAIGWGIVLGDIWLWRLLYG